MLVDEIRTRMKAAMKARNTVTKEVLRVALGEISTQEARTGEALSDAKVEAILRKLLKSNNETLKALDDEERKAQLAAENVVLQELLPKTLDEAEVKAALAEVLEQIKACGNDGQATGVAMRHLKGQGAQVDGRTVSAAVKALRADG